MEIKENRLATIIEEIIKKGSVDIKDLSRKLKMPAKLTIMNLILITVN